MIPTRKPFSATREDGVKVTFDTPGDFADDTSSSSDTASTVSRPDPDLQAQIESLEHQLEETRNQVRERDDKISALEKELKFLFEFSFMETQEISTLKESRDALEAENAAIKESRDALEAENAAIKQEYNACLEKEKIAMMKTCDTLKEENDSLKEEIYKLGNEIQVLENHHIVDLTAQKDHEISTLNATLASWQECCTQKDHEISALKSYLDTRESWINYYYSKLQEPKPQPEVSGEELFKTAFLAGQKNGIKIILGDFLKFGASLGDTKLKDGSSVLISGRLPETLDLAKINDIRCGQPTDTKARCKGKLDADSLDCKKCKKSIFVSA